jgi:hypothetical protein
MRAMVVGMLLAVSITACYAEESKTDVIIKENADTALIRTTTVCEKRVKICDIDAAINAVQKDIDYCNEREAAFQVEKERLLAYRKDIINAGVAEHVEEEVIN